MGFPIEKHNELGLELIDIHNRMLQMMGAIYDNYPKDSKVWALTNRAAGAIMELRCELDACVNKEHKDNKDFDPFKIYFSRIRKKMKSSHLMGPSPEHRQ